MKKLFIILMLTSVAQSAFSQLITYSFAPQVNNGDGTQTLTLRATANANIANGSWSTGRLGFRFPLSATGLTAVTYGTNYGANGGVPDSKFTGVSFSNGAAGGFSDPIGGTTGITTFLLSDVGGINDDSLYIGLNWAAPPNSAMTSGVPVTVLSFKVPSTWSCVHCFEITNTATSPDKLGAALSAQFDLSISQSNVGGGATNIAVPGTFGSLPVVFNSYDVKCNDKGALLTWSTASEQNSSTFEIQRSNNGTDWKTVGSIAAAGNSNDTRNYQYLDISGGGAAQYRIRQVDIDGRFIYTAVRLTNCHSVMFNVVLYPVPADDKLNVVVKSDMDISTGFKVVDMSGKTVKFIQAHINKGNTNFTVPTANLSAGQYILVSSDPALNINNKFIVSH